MEIIYLELTIDQALQKGIEAHKAGQLQQAERYYTAILKAQPNHPDANHNLGVLAMGVNKTDLALPFLEKALESNSSVSQFWESYIDALIKLDMMEEARNTFNKFKKRSFDKGIFTIIENKLTQNPEPSDSLITKNSTSGQPTKKHLEAIINLFQTGEYEQSLDQIHELQKDFPLSASLFNLRGAIYAELNKDQCAVSSYQKAIEIEPGLPTAYYNLGIIMKRKGSFDDAIKNFKEAIKINPDLFEAYYNLGNTMKDMGDLDAAIINYNKVIEINPNFVDAYFNLGVSHQEKGNLEKAIQCYQNALKINPNYLDAMNNMGGTFLDQGDVKTAINIFKNVIKIKPDFHGAYFNIAFAIEGLKFTMPDHELEKIIAVLLDKETFVRPRNIVKSVISLINLNTNIKTLHGNINHDDLSNLYAEAILTINKVPLLIKLLKVCPIVSKEFETVFTRVRFSLLLDVSKVAFSSEVIKFQTALALQCFLNEYVYNETNQELTVLTSLEKKIKEIFSSGKQPGAQIILCLASYKPLHEYEWCDLLEETSDIEEIYKMQVLEPRYEKKLGLNIPSFQKITNEVSLKVRNQYEENPYPRWVNLGLRLNPVTILEITKELRLRIPQSELIEENNLDILSAGCGTGLHPISTACRFKNCEVLAVDLSLSSLSYAKRKSQELSVKNIDYLQADILDLEQLGRKFDVVESCGVLHHMGDPMAGWKVLVNCLKKGGLMSIGLYSKVARQHIIEIREEISRKGITADANEMKSTREYIKNSKLKHHRDILSWGDFYSLSEYRDLLFHVQEHTFTITQIKSCLEDLGLVFCGFELSAQAVQKFRSINKNDNELYNLDSWQIFEEDNPAVFSDMYQFWCQKIA